MSSKTSPEDCSPSCSRSSAYTETTPTFQCYAEYLATLNRAPIDSSFHGAEHLWLGQFTENGHCKSWHYCSAERQRFLRKPTGLPAVDGNGAIPYTLVCSPPEFRTVLQNVDEGVAYRVVIVTMSHESPSSRVSDIIGLGLDLEPELFDYVRSVTDRINLEPGNRAPLPWFKDPPAIRIGNNVLSILNVRSGEHSRTAILYLKERNHLPNLWGPDSQLHSKVPRYPHGSTMFPTKRPSQIRKASCNEPERPDPDHYNTWLVQRFITAGTGSNNAFGAGNFLYICLAGLLELHLSTAPWNVPTIGLGLEGSVSLKYRGLYHRGSKEYRVERDKSNLLWAALRAELDQQRTTLRWMTRFYQKHFDHTDHVVQAAFDDIKELFENRVQNLEQAESELKDHIASEGFWKSYHMAEMSIRESKRVMLLTGLAFVFLPFSLAASVYGMNVQQINGTGHSIGAFLITAIAMCASSAALWAAAAALQSYKRRLLSKEEFVPNEMEPWYEGLVMFGPRRALQLLRWQARKTLRREGEQQ